MSESRPKVDILSRLRRLHKDRRGTATISVISLTVVGTIIGTSTLSTVQASTEAFHLGEASIQAHSALSVEAQNEHIALLRGEDGDATGVRRQFDTVDREGADHFHSVSYREHQASHVAGYDTAGNPLWVDRLGSQHHRFSQLKASGNMAMGLDEGSIWSWGQNNVYQLGVGDNADRHEPARVDTDVVFEELVQPTDTTACAIEAETRHLWCWGANHWQQLGAHSEVGEYVDTPTQVTDFAVAEGEKKVALTPNTLHVIDANNRLRSQGENAGATSGDSVPFNTVLSGAHNVVADIHTALVVHGNGQLSAFTLNGLGASGQAGEHRGVAPASSTAVPQATIVPAGQLAEDQGELTPVRIPHPKGGSWREVFIAPNDSELYASTGYAIDTQDRLSAFGNNNRGQMGVETPNAIHPSPLEVSTGITTMVASGSSAAAIQSSGHVLTWGHTDGLGRNGTSLPTRNGVSSASELVVSTGDRQVFCAMTSAGTRCWGDDTHHQVMGSGVTTVDERRSTNYAMAVIGDGFVCARDQALLTDCWGRAELGETARGVTGSAHDPAPIARRGDHPAIFRGIHTGGQDHFTHHRVEQGR